MLLTVRSALDQSNVIELLQRSPGVSRIPWEKNYV
jgi:hypothetical protein